MEVGSLEVIPHPDTARQQAEENLVGRQNSRRGTGRDPERQGAFTWVWGLYPEDQARTRLVTRLRWRAGGAFSQLLIDTVEIWMMRKCLLGIKRRAEDEMQRAPSVRGPG